MFHGRVAIHVDGTSFSNEDLVIGTPEYNKVRYPSSYNGQKPIWKSRIDIEMEKRAKGTFKARRLESSHVVHPGSMYFADDISQCINNNLHLKTKSFEYIPKTGQIFSYGQHIATVDRSRSYLSSFTFKNINTEKSRYRLRTLGINTLHVKGRTYWKLKFGHDYLEHAAEQYGGKEAMAYHFRRVFPSMKIDIETDARGGKFYKVLLELVPELTYPVWSNAIQANTLFVVDSGDWLRETDILCPQFVTGGCDASRAQLKFDFYDEF